MYDIALKLLINGQWRDGSDGRSEPVINPATGEVLGQVPHASMSDLDEALAASERGFRVWSAMTARQRYAMMSKAADLIEQRKEAIARIMTLENGKPLAEAQGEVQFSADATRWYAEEGKRAYGRIVPASAPGIRQMVYKEPVGPVLGFAAWNFPASNVIRKIAGALGAGCSVIVKPAEETPGVAVALAQAFLDADVPDGVIGIVFGVPADVSSHLIASPIAKKVSLTGSTEVGKLLQKLSADTVKRTTMELGGHAPVIVFEDADFDNAVNTLVAFKFRNAGQVCTSPTRFYVQEAIYDRFTTAFTDAVQSLKVGNGLEADVRMGPMIAERRLNAMRELVADAVSSGARLLTGGERMERDGYFFAPTVLADVPDTARIMNEEPFGPIAPIARFSSYDEVIARANALPYGLASFVFTQNLTTASKAEADLDAGLVGVNHMLVSTPETPFGGVNESGFGSESGLEGLEAFMRTKFVTEKML